MKYVVLQTGGKQYKAIEGAVLEIDKVKAEVGQEWTFDNVLLFADEGAFHVGTPTLSNVTVTGKVLDQVKGKKIRVAKFKAKARYRKVQGFRPQLTKVQIEKIVAKETKQAKA